MLDLGRKFLFFINKIENNTIHITEVLQDNSTSLEYSNYNPLCVSNNVNSTLPLNISSPSSNSFYDSSGAAKYIVVVVLVYGFGIIFFIGSQVRSTKKFSDDVDGINAEKILRSMETEIFTKEVLEKLSNKEHREKAWKIYLTDNQSQADKIASNNSISHLSINREITDTNVKEIDKEAFESIEKKLKILHKNTPDYTEEIETIKEVPSKQPKPKSSFKNNSKSKKKNSKNAKSGAPLLILQTDVEGLIKLKESKLKKNQSSTGKEHVNKSILSLLTTNEYENDSLSVNSSVSFDLCEISEQITSV